MSASDSGAPAPFSPSREILALVQISVTLAVAALVIATVRRV